MFDLKWSYSYVRELFAFYQHFLAHRRYTGKAKKPFFDNAKAENFSNISRRYKNVNKIDEGEVHFYKAVFTNEGKIFPQILQL